MPKEYPREPRIQGQAGIAPQDSPTDAPQDVGDLNNIGMHRTLMARDTELSHRADLEAGGGLTARVSTSLSTALNRILAKTAFTEGNNDEDERNQVEMDREAHGGCSQMKNFPSHTTELSYNSISTEAKEPGLVGAGETSGASSIAGDAQSQDGAVSAGGARRSKSGMEMRAARLASAILREGGEGSDFIREAKDASPLSQATRPQPSPQPATSTVSSLPAAASVTNLSHMFESTYPALSRAVTRAHACTHREGSNNRSSSGIYVFVFVCKNTHMTSLAAPSLGFRPDNGYQGDNDWSFQGRPLNGAGANSEIHYDNRL